MWLNIKSCLLNSYNFNKCYLLLPILPYANGEAADPLHPFSVTKLSASSVVSLALLRVTIAPPRRRSLRIVLQRAPHQINTTPQEQERYSP